MINLTKKIEEMLADLRLGPKDLKNLKNYELDFYLDVCKKRGVRRSDFLRLVHSVQKSDIDARIKRGHKIKKFRKSKGMTLEEFGKEIGVRAATVRRWEKGMTRLENVYLKRLRETFDLTV